MSLILVVDDQAIFRDPLAASLRLAGYETVCADEGYEALQLTRWRRPDLILLDVAMPKMDGITFLKHLRNETAHANTRVIVVSAKSDKECMQAVASFGVTDYFVKSRFRIKDLLKRMEINLHLTATSESKPGSTYPQMRTNGTAGEGASTGMLNIHTDNPH